MHGIYAHARFGDLDIDARSQWVSRSETAALNEIDNEASNEH